MSFDRSSLLSGRTVVVAGGAGALGRSFCEDIAAAGGFPVVADRDIDQARAIADAIGAERAGAVALDVTSTPSVEAMIAEVHEKHGRIDAVVNSAYPRNKQYGRKFEDVTYEDFSENMSQHVGGIFLVSQKFASYLERGGFEGVIVNIASIYGVMAPRFEVYDDTPMTMPVEYAAIKSAVVHLTKYMAKYFFEKNIRVNCISPGGIMADQPEAFLSKYRSHCASKGMLDKHDISGTLIFLLSDLSGFINGQNIVVDDGFSL